MGALRFDAINEYIKNVELCRNKSLEVKDVLFKLDESEKFKLWFESRFKPFNIYEFDSGNISVILDQYDYNYDFYEEMQNDEPYYGDGHCYEDLFRDYISDNFPKLSNKLNYDSENGMFCVYCDDMKTADEIADKLSTLYKDENKMIDLIRQTKERYNYEFDIKI